LRVDERDLTNAIRVASIVVRLIPHYHLAARGIEATDMPRAMSPASVGETYRLHRSSEDNTPARLLNRDRGFLI
jgi:hypothetical protein